MKHIYAFILLSFLSFSMFGQQAYYNGIDFPNLNGTQTKDALATRITSTHTTFLSYAEAYQIIKNTDEDPNNSANVLLIYNSQSEPKTNTIGGGNTSNPEVWNREHTYPKSLGVPDLGTSGPGSDVHHLRASEANVNGDRGSKLFATGSGNFGTVGANWYPGDAWKGNVARMMMYMYLRYGNQCLPSNVCVGTTNSIDSDMINLLLEWNAADGVSIIETQRNDILETEQGNRNPFIDNPYLATHIWGETPATDTWGIYATDTQAPTIPTNLVASNPTANTVDLSWTASTDNIAVTSYDVYIGGVLNANTGSNATSYTVTGLAPETTYSFTVLAKDAANNMSAQSTTVNETTTAASTSSNELFLSEYMEGSSNNKAIEIANFTGATVDLSIYTLKKSANGSATWSNTYAFPASAEIIAGDVYVVANSSLAVCTGVVDDTSTSQVFTFNGNDPIGLFKNDVLIDIIGVLGNSANFAANTTIVRNPEIVSPNTTYTASEWTSFAQNTCTDLGQHSQTLSVENYSINEFKMYPNPLKGNTLNISTNQNLNVQVYNILGKRVISTNVNSVSNQVNVSNLEKGIYLVKVTSNNQSVTRKLIKQ